MLHRATLSEDGRMRLKSPIRRRRAHAPALVWVTADLAIGRAPAADEWRQVAAAGIRAVVDLRVEGDPDGGLAEASGLAYLSLPIADGAAPETPALVDLARWAVDQIESGRPVLLHCREGRGRSVLAACAVLRELGYAGGDAYALVRRAQPTAVLSDEQVRALDAYAPSKGMN
jgi:protein tyrosine phosphatase (PTP) superfamily phosphohydrolase (DUF442 family)